MTTILDIFGGVQRIGPQSFHINHPFHLFLNGSLMVNPYWLSWLSSWPLHFLQFQKWMVPTLKKLSCTWWSTNCRCQHQTDWFLLVSHRSGRDVRAVAWWQFKHGHHAGRFVAESCLSHPESMRFLVLLSEFTSNPYSAWINRGLIIHSSSIKHCWSLLLVLIGNFRPPMNDLDRFWHFVSHSFAA